MRVLIADDNEVDRLLLSSIVRREGYEVECAVDGNDAVERFQSFQPQMVLLDALMPGMDGFDVARIIKEAPGDGFVPVIFLTSLTEAGELARCIEAGGDDFLSKPYNKVILKAKLNAFARMASLHATTLEQRDQISQHHLHLVQEQEAAKAVFDSVAHSGALGSSNIKHLISPLAIFNGDVLLAAFNPSGGLHVLLGDFTGHGLTAAIGAMPLAEIFYGMTQKGFQIGEILRECNRKLKVILPPGYFCCAMFVDMNFHKRTVEYWNGGLPGGWLYRPENNAVLPLRSSHLPLGILDQARFDEATQILELSVGDRLIMCTDGVIEARNQAGIQLGVETLHDMILDNKRPDDLFDNLKSAIYDHMGGESRDDDITLVEVEMVGEGALPKPNTEVQELPSGGPEEWRLSYELGPRSLRSFNPLPLLQHVLMELPRLQPYSVPIYTVLSELYSNALEHGVLGLDSRLKSNAEGFARYYEERARALEGIEGFVRFEFDCRCNAERGVLVIRVVDSGGGFDFASLENRDMNGGDYHGRGLPLLRELCTELEFVGNGNTVQARFEW